MRRFLAFSVSLLLAGCATAPQQAPAPQQAIAPQAPQGGSLIGLTPQQLVSEFGTPTLQIHEGASLKLQFRGPQCVMDTYLYPSGSPAALKVTHVDTRLPSGSDMDQAACVLALRRSS